MRLLEVGEIVEYYSRRYDPEPSHVGKVLESLPKGIPSYPHPMVKLEGKAGYLSAEHCMPAKVTRNVMEPIQALVNLDKELFPNSREFNADDIAFMRKCQDLPRKGGDLPDHECARHEVSGCKVCSVIEKSQDDNQKDEK